MTHPLVDTARLQLSGISAEEINDIPKLGEMRVYTVLTRCVGHAETEMANEGTRRVTKMKIVQLLPGVDPAIEDMPQNQPSLFDAAPGDPDVPDGPTFADGPTFSEASR